DIIGIIGRLADGRFDKSDLFALEGHPPDPRIIPGLKFAFAHREAKNQKQAIAATLLRLGEKSDRYFDFLAVYAREAVEDRTPSFFRYDENGRAVRGEFSAEFANWCALNGKDPKSIAAIQVSVYLPDVLALAET